MEKVKYVSLAGINKTLTESLVGVRGNKPKNKLKTICLESVSSRVNLTEAISEILDSAIDTTLLTFKDVEGNNKKIEALVAIFNKVRGLGEFDKTPALKKALITITATPTNDKLKSLLSVWLKYLGAENENQNPLLNFNKEISFLSNMLTRLKGIKAEGSTMASSLVSNIDTILSGDNLVEILKKLSKSLFDHAEALSKLTSKPQEAPVAKFTPRPINYGRASEKQLAFECIMDVFSVILDNQ